MWPVPQLYRAFVGGVQAQEAFRRAAGKGGIDDDGRFVRQAADDGYKLWYSRVGRRSEVNRDKVWLAWFNHITGMGFVKVRSGRGLIPHRVRGRALLGPRHY